MAGNTKIIRMADVAIVYVLRQWAVLYFPDFFIFMILGNNILYSMAFLAEIYFMACFAVK